MIKAALLTESESEWLLGNRTSVSKSYEYKMKSNIRKKLSIFAMVEIPLIQNSGIFSKDFTALGKDLTVFGKDDNSINYLNIENSFSNMVGRKGLATYLSLKEDYTYSNI